MFPTFARMTSFQRKKLQGRVWAYILNRKLSETALRDIPI